MPPVGAAIAGVAGLFGAGGALAAGTIGGFLVKLGAGVGLNYLAGALKARSSADQLAEEQRPVGTKFKLAAGGKVPRSFILGRWATAGSLVYHGTHGDSEKIPNPKYVQVSALSDLPVSDLRAVIVNGREVDYDPGGSQPDAGQAISNFYKGDKNNFWIKFKDGTQTSGDDHLVAKFGSDPDYPITESYTGRGVAWASWTARYNEKLWAGAGDISVSYVVDGLKLYDIRKDTTAGGSGPHRWDDPSTWEFTRNPVVMIYNIIRGLRYDGEWVYGGQTFGAAQLPFASWAAAMNECDAEVETKDGGTQPQFRAGGEVELSSEPLDIIDRLLKACNGRLADSGGIYTIAVGAVGAAVLSFTDDDIIIDDEQTFEPFPGHDATVNGIIASYVSSGAGWTEKTAPPIYSPADEEADGDRRLLANVTYDFVNGTQQVQRLARAALAEARRFRRHVITLPPAIGLQLDPLDVVAWTSSRNGYVGKLFRVDQITVRPNLDVVAYITEVDPSDYDWDAEADELDEFEDGIVLTPPTVPALQDWTATGVVIAGDGGRSVAGIRLAWDPDPDLDDDGGNSIARIDFEVRHAISDVLVLASNTPFVSRGAIDISQNLAPSTEYEVRGRYWSPVLDTTWTGWIGVTTPDVRIVFNQLEDQFQYFIRLVHQEIEGSFSELRDRARAIFEEQAAGTLVDILEQYHQRRALLSLLVKETEDRRAAIVQVAEAIVNGDEAVASMVTALEAQFGGNVSGLVSQVETIASALSATSSLLTEVQARSDATSASGKMRVRALTDNLGGATASFAVELDVGTPGSASYKATGLYLEITGSGPNITSRIMLDTDQLIVGTSSGDTGKQLLFEASGGVVKIRNALIGQLGADNIAAKAVKADKMDVDALSAITGNVGLLTAGRIQDSPHESDNPPGFPSGTKGWRMRINLAAGNIIIRDSS